MSSSSPVFDPTARSFLNEAARGFGVARGVGKGRADARVGLPGLDVPAELQRVELGVQRRVAAQTPAVPTRSHALRSFGVSELTHALSDVVGQNEHVRKGHRRGHFQAALHHGVDLLGLRDDVVVGIHNGRDRPLVHAFLKVEGRLLTVPRFAQTEVRQRRSRVARGRVIDHAQAYEGEIGDVRAFDRNVGLRVAEAVFDGVTGERTETDVLSRLARDVEAAVGDAHGFGRDRRGAAHRKVAVGNRYALGRQCQIRNRDAAVDRDVLRDVERGSAFGRDGTRTADAVGAQSTSFGKRDGGIIRDDASVTRCDRRARKTQRGRLEVDPGCRIGNKARNGTVDDLDGSRIGGNGRRGVAGYTRANARRS